MIKLTRQIYIDKFSVPAKNIARISSLFGFIKQLPRFVLEAVVFGGILLVVLYLMAQFAFKNNLIHN